MRFMNIFHWNRFEFREKGIYKPSLRIFLFAVIHRIINPNGIYSSSTSLHLKLRIVNSWLVICKELRNSRSNSLPRLHTGITEETHKYSSGSKVTPTSLLKLSYERVDIGDSRSTRKYFFNQLSIYFLTNCIKVFIEISKLHLRFILKFLNKM